MSTWAQLLADIRIDLKDTGSTPRWTDDALYLYTKDAIKDFSTHFPVVKRAILSAANEAYALPADLVEIWNVECPAGRFLERRLERPGSHYNTTAGRPTQYFIEGGSLYLNGDPLSGETVVLTYGAQHAIPDDAKDTTHTLTIPPMDEELIRLYVKAKAAEQIRTQQASLDRFKLGSGARDDNPLAPETGNLIDEYRSKIAERYPGGIIKLYRPRAK
jgi:hypothetical protein